MVVLFSTACCGVTEEGKIWAVPDGETLDVSQELADEMVRCGYGVVVASKADSKPKPKAKAGD